MTAATTIAQRLAQVRGQVHRACLDSGREPDEVTLVAVSKLKPAADIQAAMAAGQLHFGENYAQHLRDKARELGVGPAVTTSAGQTPGPPMPVWHFIGPLQRNKVKYVVGSASLVHAVDSEKLGQAIGRRSQDHPTSILVQVNIGLEDSKHGVAPVQCLPLCTVLRRIPGLRLRGLMCIPPMADSQRTAGWFRQMGELAAEGRSLGMPLELLSMGMSHDYPLAIAHGATHVRVGAAIFGARG